MDTTKERLALGEGDFGREAKHRAGIQSSRRCLRRSRRLADRRCTMDAAHDGERVPEQVDERERPLQPAHGGHGWLRRAAYGNTFVGLRIPGDEPSARRHSARVCLQLPHEEGERAGQQDVVGVEERDVAGLDCSQAEVASRADAEPHVRANDAYLRPEVRHRSLGGVVDHDHANVDVRLPERALRTLSAR